MTATTTPLDAARSGYAAFARGDVPAVLGLLDPRVEGTEAAGLPYPGTFVGTVCKVARFRQHTDTVLVRAAMQA